METAVEGPLYWRIGHRIGERQHLVFRYSRTMNGEVVFYGRVQPGFELHFSVIKGRLEQLSVDRSWDSFWAPFNWSQHSTSERTQLGLVEKQLELVVMIWEELIDLIRTGRYAPPEHTVPQGYCTSIIDVRLLNALDALRTLDADAGRSVRHYERIFKTYSGPACHCPPCRGDMRMWHFLCTGSIIYHSSLHEDLWWWIFGELDLDDDEQPWQ